MGLLAGAASRDITPELRGEFFGYVRPDLRARGVALRLQAHALVLERSGRRIAMVVLDLGAPLIAEALWPRLAAFGLHRDACLISATHTHAAPYRPGAFVVDQVVAAVAEAVARLRPAQAGWGSATLRDANQSRSLEAHLANHGLDLYPGTGTDDLDPLGADHPRDLRVRVLRVDERDGRPVAVWGHFAAHPTTFVPANTSFSSDFPGVATRVVREALGDPAPVVALANGTEGDLITRFDDVNQHACADRIGRRVAAAMQRAYEAAAPSDEVAVAGAWRRITYQGQELEPGVRVGRRAWFGLPFLGGGRNGPSFFYGLGLEGRRRPHWLADAVHGRKLRVAPAPWPPEADVTVLRIGDRLLLGVPGEPTVEAGRRMERIARLAAQDGGIGDALVIGLAQAYRGYFTTPAEYDQQHYEGGHTVFGRHTSRLVELAHAELAGQLAEPAPPPPSVAPSPDPADARPGVVPGRPARRLRLLAAPPERIERYGTVTVAWRGARRGVDRPVDRPFVVLEALQGDRYEAVEDDLGTAVVWTQRGWTVTARAELRGDAPVGTHRIVVHGRRASLVTPPFEVVISRGLEVRGATLAPDGALLLHVQPPPPDPARALRARPRHLAGGRAQLRIDGQERIADWDERRGALTVPTARLPTARPRTLEVAPGDVEDVAGNRNGEGSRHVVGVVADLRWPAHLGPGGGRAPAPFGWGRRGRPAPWP